METCLCCGDDVDEVFVCQGGVGGNPCVLSTCRECAERMINGGDTRCPACRTDVLVPLRDFFMDDLSKKLLSLTLSSEVNDKVRAQVAAAEEARKKIVTQLVDLNGEAARLADLFQADIMDACPRCNTKFNDFSGCVALTCASCHTGFCALCLKEGKCSTHGHISGHL